jgi:CDP-diacylglycerol---serine O-phosphatidyltransferase
MDLRLSIPQTVTASRILFGGSALFAAIFRRADLAATLITLGAVTDGLDGPLARMLGVTSDFGALFDYFADYLCYIVAPSVLSFVLVKEPPGVFSLIILGLPVLSGAIRYARNAVWLRKENFAEMGFPGLGTVIYAFFIVTLTFINLEEFIGVIILKRLVLIIIFMVSCLMVLPLRYPKLMKFNWLSVPVLLGITLMPFCYPRILAGIALALGCVYTFVSPFFMDQRPRHSSFQTTSESPGNPLHR